jgi:hypothetical protein
MTVTEELSKKKLDLVVVQEVRWNRSGTKPIGKYTLFYGKGNKNHELRTGFPFFFPHKRSITTVKRVEFVSDRFSYIILVLLSCWCDVIFLKLQAPRDDEINIVACRPVAK